MPLIVTAAFIVSTISVSIVLWIVSRSLSANADTPIVESALRRFIGSHSNTILEYETAGGGWWAEIQLRDVADSDVPSRLQNAARNEPGFYFSGATDADLQAFHARCPEWWSQSSQMYEVRLGGIEFGFFATPKPSSPGVWHVAEISNK
jgi:hypothetical protein